MSRHLDNTLHVLGNSSRFVVLSTLLHILMILGTVSLEGS